MHEPANSLTLADYRRRVHDIYRDVREATRDAEAWEAWKSARDLLFSEHPQSALEDGARDAFGGLRYFDHDPQWRVTAEVEPAASDDLSIAHNAEGVTRFRRFGTVTFEVGDVPVRLALYWLDAYGGGIFLPFRDTTAGEATYGGGRYLLDTVKGADLGMEEGRIVLDFNYAYHPSCVYSTRWSCPLAPAENRIPVAIEGGERLDPAS